MNTHAEQTRENESRAAANRSTDTQGRVQNVAGFTDNRPVSAMQQRVLQMANESQNARQFNIVQQKAEDDDELIQGKFDTVQKKVNDTGLPDNLKSGVEQMSGYSMDDVRVHYNSSKPADLNALAYTQGTDIHVAPGQERHLPHEAWHVVQQMQGRVRPTMQLKGGVNVNDDAGLEREAGIVGEIAINKIINYYNQNTKNIRMPVQILQGKWIHSHNKNLYMWHHAIDGFRWFYNGLTSKMFFIIEDSEYLLKDDIVRLEPFQKVEFSYDEWLSAGWAKGAWLASQSSIVPEWGYKLFRAVEKINKLRDIEVVSTGKDKKEIAPKYWGEALDAKHRPVEGQEEFTQETLRKKYDEDPIANLHMNFYDWLKTQHASKEDVVVYMNEEARRDYVVTIIDGNAIGNKIQKNENAFVIANGVMYAAPKQTGSGKNRIHHSSFLSGTAVSCAGKMFITDNNKIFYVMDYSGHYQPGVRELKYLQQFLVERNSGDVELRKRNGKQFTGKIKDWDENE